LGRDEPNREIAIAFTPENFCEFGKLVRCGWHWATGKIESILGCFFYQF
jgi:hypothetical protein